MSRRFTLVGGLLAVVAAALCSGGCGGKVLTSSGGDGAGAGSGGAGGAGGSGDDGGAPDAGDTGADSVADVGGDDSASDAHGKVPVYHRPDDSQCSTPRSPGTCSTTVSGFMCSKDGDCTSGVNGRCENSPGGPAGCFCTYDTCSGDTECKTGELCVCHGSAYAYGGNSCMPGNCRVDSDCGTGGYCSPAHGTADCGNVTGYYCHTPKDTCTNDSDCGSGLNVCTWSQTDGRWECQMALLCA